MDKPNIAIWLTSQQIGKLKSLSLARMYHSARLVDKWSMKLKYANTPEKRYIAQARIDAYQHELDMLTTTWTQLRAAFRYSENT